MDPLTRRLKEVTEYPKLSLLTLRVPWSYDTLTEKFNLHTRVPDYLKADFTEYALGSFTVKRRDDEYLPESWFADEEPCVERVMRRRELWIDENAAVSNRFQWRRSFVRKPETNEQL